MAGPHKIVDPTKLPPPVQEEKLSPDQKRIRELEDRLAQTEGKKDPEPEWVSPAQGSAENILIHFLEDGFTALGQVFTKGQELEFTPGSPAYEDTKDRHGASWLGFRSNDFAQVERWGKVMFREGPWPGKSYADAQFEPLRSVSGDGKVSGPTREELMKAWEAEKRRGRAAPTLPSI